MEPSGGWPTGGKNASDRPTTDIQTELKRLKFYSGAIDGGYGPETSKAEGKFQQTRWLVVDGIHGMTSDGIMFPPKSALSFGVDYSEARPGGALLQQRGTNFAGRYLWNPKYQDGRTNKGISRAEYDDLVAHKVFPFFFYETSAEDSMAGGFNVGVKHAIAAQKFLDALGLPNHPIHFNVDHDATVAQLPQILEGMKGAASIVGKKRAGIYGEFDVVRAVLDAGHTYACQTYAWSGGKWDDRATTRQWSNGQWPTVPGNSDTAQVDFEWQMAKDFGQNPVT